MSVMQKAKDAAASAAHSVSALAHTGMQKVGLEQQQGEQKKQVSGEQPTMPTTLAGQERLAASKRRDERTGNDGMVTMGGKAKTSTHIEPHHSGAVLQGSEAKVLPRNRGIVFMGEGKVELKEIPYPQMKFPWSDKPITNAMQSGTIIGHEICGEIVEAGPGVHLLRVGDWGVVNFNVACGCCDSCVRMRPEICEITNNQKHEVGQGGLYGYICGGGWQGGQAEYVFVPFADYNMMPLHDKSVARQKLLDITLISDVLPTAQNAVVNADVQLGSTVFIAGAGPIGLCAAMLGFAKGAAAIIISDHKAERLAQAAKLGCFTINLTEAKEIPMIKPLVKKFLGCEEVDCFIDAIGYEAEDATPLNLASEILRSGAWLSVPGVYAMGDPKGSLREKAGIVDFNFGKLWMKGTTIRTGQTSVIRYNRGLLSMILHGRIHPADMLNVKVISLEEAAQAYSDFSKKERVPNKYIIDPFNTLGLWSTTSTPSTLSSSSLSSSSSSLSSSSTTTTTTTTLPRAL